MVAPALGQATRPLQAHGSREMYWIARTETLEAAAVQTVIQQRPIGQTSWQRIALIKAPVVSMAHRGRQLSVLLDSGDWMTVWDGGSSAGARPDDGAVLKQFACWGDDLWALADPAAAPATAASTPATAPSSNRAALYRQQQGRWILVAPVPLGAGAKVWHLAIVDGVPTVAVLGPDSLVQIMRLAADSEWEMDSPIHAPPGATRIKLLAGLARPTLWIGDDASPGSLFHRDTSWSGPVPLTLTGEAPKASASSVTVAGESIRLLLLPAQGKRIVEYAFGPDGRSQGRSELSIVPPVVQERPLDWFRMLVAVLLLMVMLNTLRGRSIEPPESLESAGIALAPYWRRGLAALVDALPLLGTLGVALVGADADTAADPQALYDRVMGPMLIASGIYLIHTTVSELLWGWTIGKKLVGLRVVMLDGTAPTRRALVIRNVLRLIDVVLVFPPLLVFVSPFRQRVGDIGAETLVVLAGRTEVSGKESGST